MARRTLVLVVGGVALGCAAERPPVARAVTIAPPDAHPAASRAKSESEALAAELESGARWGDSAPPRVLYTWTNSDQIETLEYNPRLLSRSRSDEGLLSLFDTVLADDPSPLARLFRRRELSLRRFAWSNPWATVAGWEGERYGNRLLRVQLKSEALVLYYDPTLPKRWRATDLAGVPVPLATVLLHPERIAAVYHVYPGKKSGANAAPFREFVLVNESMIAHWEYATPSVRRDLEKARALLDGLVKYARRHPATLPSDPVAFWKHAPDHPTVAELYAANLAFPNGLYQLDPDRVASIVRHVDLALSTNRSDALSVTPVIRFADQGKGVTPPSQKSAPRRMCWTMPCPVKPGHP